MLRFLTDREGFDRELVIVDPFAIQATAVGDATSDPPYTVLVLPTGRAQVDAPMETVLNALGFLRTSYDADLMLTVRRETIAINAAPTLVLHDDDDDDVPTTELTEVGLEYLVGTIWPGSECQTSGPAPADDVFTPGVFEAYIAKGPPGSTDPEHYYARATGPSAALALAEAMLVLARERPLTMSPTLVVLPVEPNPSEQPS